MKKEKKYYHFIGICGSSMSGIAQLVHAMGNKVSGSDLRGCKIGILPNDKNKDEIIVYRGHSKDNISSDISLVVRTSAVTPGSEGWKEVEKAKELGIPVVKRSEFIGKIIRDYISIGVTGMHGKTTTSSMIASILFEAGFDPSFLIGSTVRNIDNLSSRLGGSVLPVEDNKKKVFAKKRDLSDDGKVKYFVAEACEYDRSFLDIKPRIGVITNIDREHLDYYTGGINEIRQAFKKFIKNLPKDGLLIVWQEDKYVMPLIKSAKCKVKLVSRNKIWLGLNLKLPGKHNLINATLAARVCHEIGVKHEVIKKALNNFIGAGRRFEIKGEKNGVIVVDDYGHHPTEIKATIEAARSKYPDKKIMMIFQPHQYQRTKILFDEFKKCFKGLDRLIVNDVYKIAGREKDTKDNLSERLCFEIKGVDCKYISSYEEIGKYLKNNVKKGSVIITQGATDIYKVGENYLK